MSQQIPITRTCSICGIEKPINAFLQLSETQGTHYGTICMTCRSEGKTHAPPKTQQSDDETSTAPSGSRIGAKEKVFVEEEKSRQLKNLKELYRKEQRVIDDRAELKTEKSLQKQRDERFHRETFIDAKKQRGFLGQQNPTTTQTQRTPVITPDLTNQDQVSFEQNKQLEENQQQNTSQQQNTTQQENTIFSERAVSPTVDPKAGEMRYGKVPLTAIKTWLGNRIVNTTRLEQLHKKTVQTQVENAKQQTEKPLRDKKFQEFKIRDRKFRELKEKQDKTKNPVVDYIEKTWNPSSRKR